MKTLTLRSHFSIVGGYNTNLTSTTPTSPFLTTILFPKNTCLRFLQMGICSQHKWNVTDCRGGTRWWGWGVGGAGGLGGSCSPPTPLVPPLCIRAIDLDQNTIVAISVGVVSVAVGIGVPVFYETQIDNAAKRENTQPCFPCNGSGNQKCRFCAGTGSVTVELGGEEKEVSRCINCDGAGSLTCTTCQGSGIQPRYLDRREFKDDD